MLKELIEKYFKEVIVDNPGIVEEINTIFEGAVNNQVNEIKVSKELELEKTNEADLKVFKEEIVNKLDEYIELSMTEFTDNNKTLIESDIKISLAEKIISNIRNILVEEVIEIPEGQTDIIVDLENKLKTVTDKLNENINQNVKYKQDNFDLEKKMLFEKLTIDIVDSKKEMLLSLVENIDFSDIEDYEKKIDILKKTILERKSDDSQDKDVDDNLDKDELDKYLP